VRQHCRYNRFAPRVHCPESAHAWHVLVLLAGAALSATLSFDTAGRWRSTVIRARSSRSVVIVVGAARRHAPAAAGMKLFGTSVQWTRYEPTLSATLERMPCSPARHRAPSWLAGCSTSIVTFLTITPAPLAHLNGVLACALRRGRTRRSCGQGGSSARAAVPECLGALLWRYGHIDHSRGWCEVAHDRCNGRSCTYSSGSVLPMDPVYARGGITES
jgi:hypothetical protein